MVLFLFIFTAKVLTSRPQESEDLKIGNHQQKPSHYVRTFTKYHHRRTIQWNNNNNDQDLSNYWPVSNDQPKSTGKRSIDDLNYSEYDKRIKKRSIIDDSIVQEYWPVQDQKLEKRSLEILNSNEFVSTSQEMARLDQYTSNAVRSNIVSSFEKKAISSGKENNAKNSVPENVKKYKVMAAKMPTETTTTMGPTISCLYKIHDSVAMSVTPSYDDERNAQLVVENDSFGWYFFYCWF